MKYFIYMELFISFALTYFIFFYVPKGDSIWSPRATEIFLNGCLARKMKLAEERKHDLWEEICEDLQKNGFNLSTEQVENKWKSLYRKYKKSKMADDPKKCFPYFDQMTVLANAFQKKAENLAGMLFWGSTVRACKIKFGQFSS